MAVHYIEIHGFSDEKEIAISELAVKALNLDGLDSYHRFLSLFPFMIFIEDRIAEEAVKNKIIVKQEPKLIVENRVVNLSCNYTNNLFSKEFQATLYKGVNSNEEVCTVNGNFSHEYQFLSKLKGLNCDGTMDNETVTFRLWNLSANHTDIYFCKIEVMYPPPYIRNENNNGTIIHVKEKHFCPQPPIPESSQPFWVLVVVLGVLSFYSLIITVALAAYWTKTNKNRILQSDYMNTTPRRPGPTRKHYQPYAPSRDFAAYRS
ncbi:PREDICTED: T-cell-specific surface glycoprotein CD28 [Elephantulus edwardii]|uniref:T-cell-specific surface glycoprotein CD28 n=1 Tax=Elephantulus edwardii TaxID=28737 RepID=UPI0003F099BB|nr:PREDICTED: T-cell-specific surface glycoprotein CD28 [Elephantulus edwardii]